MYCKIHHDIWYLRINIEDVQWFDVEHEIYFTFETGKSSLPSEINSIFNVKPLNILFFTFCFWFSNMFLWNLRYCVQYTTWRHNSLLFWFCKYVMLIFSQCENNSLWRYNFYSMEKIGHLTTEIVIVYINTFPKTSVCL